MPVLRRRVWIGLVSIIALATLALVRAAPPATGDVTAQEGATLFAALTPVFPYQGRLTVPSTGQPVPDGEYGMTFALYSVASGGTALWTESKGVQVERGLFATTLGDVAALDPHLFTGQALWLGVKVQADAEMTPRQPILPVPYAMSLVPGARVEADSTEPVLAVNNAGAGPALQVEGLARLTSDAEIDGTASIGGDAVIAGALWTQGMTMGKVHLTASGDICSTRGGANRLSWDKANNDLELSNTTTNDWLDYWWVKVDLGGGIHGEGNAMDYGLTNVVVVNLTGANNEGAEVHFGQADGAGGWCSAWVQYANGALVGHYLCY